MIYLIIVYSYVFIVCGVSLFITCCQSICGEVVLSGVEVGALLVHHRRDLVVVLHLRAFGVWELGLGFIVDLCVSFIMIDCLFI